MTPAQNIGLSIVFILGVILGLENQDSYATTSKYTVKVTFDSITVHNDHDGVLKGEGEWNNFAYIQGKLVQLLAEPGTVDTDETKNFSPDKEITVELSGTTPLSIFTWGYEEDSPVGLGGHGFCSTYTPSDISKDLPIFNNPGLDWSTEIENYVAAKINPLDKNCDIDRLGRIKEFYDPTQYGAGLHEVKSHTGDFTLKYTISVSKTVNIGPIGPGVIQRTCNTNLPITSVSASGDDGHVPQNVLDNNLATRWSSDGVGQFITADLGSTKNICGVDIAWYLGVFRMYNFVISTSTDGSTFTNVLTNASSGNTSNSEKYAISPIDARYVRITVNGNTQNNFASITELDIFG